MVDEITIKPRRPYLRWSTEEDRVLIDAWKSWQGPLGRCHNGVEAHLATLFSHRTKHSWRHRLDALIKAGRIPTQVARSTYQPLDLSVAECAWLAGIIDGEGGIGDPFTDVGKVKDFAIRVTLCANSDLELMARVRLLVPHARQYVNKVSGPDATCGIKTRKTVYVLTVTGQLCVLDILRCVLPYLAHSVKRQRAIRLYEWLQNHLSRKYGTRT